MTCHSGGTLEIYVEPHLPAPALWVAGTTPIAGALATLGSAPGLRVTVFDPVADPKTLPGAERVIREADLARLDPDARRTSSSRPRASGTRRRSRRRSRRDAAYVGLVASPTRAAAVRDWLRDETGSRPERLAALRAPAGIDLGAETAEEIALSILAELVQVRRGRAAFVAAPGPATRGRGIGRRSTTAEPVVDDIVLLDPVCGMTVDRRVARHLAEHEGTVYAFCPIGCRTRFIKDPAAYVGRAPPPMQR